MLENVNLTPILDGVIAILGIVITGYIVPFLKTKISAEKLEELKKLTAIAVQSAEQIFESKQGQEKKQYVLDYLNNKGYDVTGEDIDNLVESTVYTLTNWE